MCQKESNSYIQEVLSILMKSVPKYFKFHGKVATDLFLNDQLNVDDTLDICVKRSHIPKIIDVIPEGYSIFFRDYERKVQLFDRHKIDQMKSIFIKHNDMVVLNIIVYDVEHERWLFGLNHDIRIPEKHIFYHSLKWGVDYIKPEIILMYRLNEPVKPQNVTFYRKLLNQMSYFQYVILKTVIGEESLNQITKEVETKSS